jgi:hypothetical protein
MARPRAIRDRCLAMLLLLGFAQPAAAQQPTEYSVKAAFLPKFARYVNWPPQAQPPAGKPLQICVIGSDPFGTLLDEAAAGQRIEQNPVALRRMRTAADAEGCHLAFVRGTHNQSTAQILAALAGRPVLTVTDSRDGGLRGMIHFAVEKGRVSFHVNDALAARSRLDISSRLLGVALSVKQRRV